MRLYQTSKYSLIYAIFYRQPETKLDQEREDEYRRLQKDLKYLEKDLEIEQEDEQKMLEKLMKKDLNFMGTAEEYYKTLSKREREVIKEKRAEEAELDKQDRLKEIEEIKIEEAKRKEEERKRLEEQRKQEERKRRPKSRFTEIKETKSSLQPQVMNKFEPQSKYFVSSSY